jgi:hypothetical protein
MSDEISELTIANRRLQAELDKVCRLTDTYVQEHARRKAKRTEAISRALTAEDSLRQLCLFISQLFPQFSNPCDPPTADTARRILLAVSRT